MKYPQLSNIEKALLKDIQNGTYAHQYLIYVRKSTDEPDNQKNSITYQKSENIRFAKKAELSIVPLTIKGFCAGGIVSERHSGFKEDDDVFFTKDGMVQYRIERPKFQKLLELVGKGYFKGIIALSWDRMSRNKGDDTIIRKMMRSGVDVRFSYATYEDTSAGALHMDIDSMFSRHRSRVTSEKVTIATRNLRQRGICTYRAPIGYLNTGSMYEKPFDPIRAPLIKKLFERCATEKYSLNDLVRYAKEVELVGVPMRRQRTSEEMLAEEEELKDIPKISRPLNAGNISRILSNPFYLGMIKGTNGDYIDSNSHEALVEHNLYVKVQQVLKKRRVSVYYDKKLALPYRGILRCGICNRSYTPYTQKGHIYYATRCQKECDNTMRNCNLPYIEKQTSILIQKLHFNDDEFIQFQAIYQTDVALLEEKRRKEFNEIDLKKKQLRDKLAFLSSNKLSLLQTRVYSAEEYLAEQQKLNTKLLELQEQEQISDIAMVEMLKEIVELSELLKSVAGYYDFAKTKEKEEILKILFSELYISEKGLQYKLNSGLECFEHRFGALGDPNVSLLELLPQRLSVQTIIHTLKIILSSNQDIHTK